MKQDGNFLFGEPAYQTLWVIYSFATLFIVFQWKVHIHSKGEKGANGP